MAGRREPDVFCGRGSADTSRLSADSLAEDLAAAAADLRRRASQGMAARACDVAQGFAWAREACDEVKAAEARRGRALLVALSALRSGGARMPGSAAAAGADAPPGGGAGTCAEAEWHSAESACSDMASALEARALLAAAHCEAARAARHEALDRVARWRQIAEARAELLAKIAALEGQIAQGGGRGVAQRTSRV